MSALTVHLDQLPDLVGRTLVSPDWLAITQERIDHFARATDDHQWIHVDPHRAALHSPFRTTVAHGFLTLSLVVPMLFELLQVEGARLVINYGANKVRFPAPVPVGSRLRLRAEILAVEAVEGGWQLTFRATVEVEGGSKPALAADILFRFYR
jgi:acyl dehydratase